MVATNLDYHCVNWQLDQNYFNLYLYTFNSFFYLEFYTKIK